MNYNTVFEAMPRKRNYMQSGLENSCRAKRKMHAGQPESPGPPSGCKLSTFFAMKRKYLLTGLENGE